MLKTNFFIIDEDLPGKKSCPKESLEYILVKLTLFNF